MRRILLFVALLAPAPLAANGEFELAACDGLIGYSWNPGNPEEVLNVSVWVDGTFWGATTANVFRQDLLEAGIGNGYHGFQFPIPAELKNGQQHTYLIPGLTGSTKTLTCPYTGQYSYYYSDPLISINSANWYQNGSPTPTQLGLTSSAAGSVISKISVASDYEVKTTLRLAGSGGTYVTYLRASSNALSGSTPSGSYYAIEVQNPTFGGGACAATLAAYKRVSGMVTFLGSTQVPCRNGMLVRGIIRGSLVRVFIDDAYYFSFSDSALASGQPGAGVSATPADNSLARVALGAADTTAPSAVSAQSIGVSARPDGVELQWNGAADNSGGVGVWSYRLYRDGNLIADRFPGAEAADYAVQPDQSYQYTIYAVDYHGSTSSGTTVTVSTPPAGSIDPRRAGIRPDGAYWGAGGEQIDTRSGNLNFSVPLLRALGRGGWGVSFALSYNSQVWRQDGGSTWKLGRDIGFGFGWRFQAGSITPYWADTATIHHYLFTDSTGAEYRLDVNTNGIWTSRETGVYVEYDAANQKLYLPDGSFWVMGGVAAGTEQDAGTRYPTLMQDTNGNQIIIRYKQGLSTPWVNSSARPWTIEDVRARRDSWDTTFGYATYTFTYWNCGAVPHIGQIRNTIFTGDKYDFAYQTSQNLSSPFSPPVGFGTTDLMTQVTRAGQNLMNQFQYSTGTGELTKVTLPYGGYLRWEYRSFAYSGSRTLREVQNRYVMKVPGAAESAYTFYRDDIPSYPVHWWAVLGDPSGNARAWGFFVDGSGPIGASRQYSGRPSLWASDTHRREFSYAQDSAGRNYVSSVLTTVDPDQSYQVQSKTEQTVSVHGNVTQTKVYDYGQLSTPARTYNHTYLSGSNYTSRRIWNRLVSSSVTDGSTNVTLVTNTYDGGTLTDRPGGLGRHDPAYNASFHYRGNVTQRTSPGAFRSLVYDIGGNVVSANDGYGHSVSTTLSAATEFVAPDKITPGSQDNLSTNYTYNDFLGLTSVTQPDSSTTIQYDAYARPSQITPPYGAATYTYDLPNRLITATGTRITKIRLDGLGRAVKVEVGDSAGTQSIVETEYDACACSPLGRVKRVSRPYAPGGTPVWTAYTYDTLGRTTRVDLPGGTGAVTYLYQGNTVTVTDPAGKWRKYTADALGNLKQVSEPAPGGGTHETYYAYNLLGQMTQVQMPRSIPGSGTVTQYRTFSYDSAGGTWRLLSATNPENGTVSYLYNGDGTLLRKTDARNQHIEFSYDTYQRVTQKRVYNVSGQEDLCGQVDYTWDTDGTVYYWGRLVNVQWGQNTCTGGQFKQSYTYSPGGLIGSKTLSLSRSGKPNPAVQTVNFSYTADGVVFQVNLPLIWEYELQPNGFYQWVQRSGPTYTYSLDTMGRPVKLVKYDPNTATQTTLGENVAYGPAGEVTAMHYVAARQLDYYGNPYYTWYNDTRAYNVRGQMTRMQATGEWDPNGNTPPPVDLEYRFSATQNDGRITQMKNGVTGEEVNYQYDTLGRLSLAETTGLEWGQSFSYDGFGNLTAETATKGTAFTSNFNYDAATNRLLAQGVYSYDANGNLTAMPSITNTYDVENRLAQGVHTLNGTEQYVYSPSNQRVWKKNASQSETAYVYGPDGARLATMNASWGGGDHFSQTSLELRLGGRLITSVASGDSVESLAQEDRLGTVGASSYFPYGETRSGGAGFQFATYRRDSATQFDYAQQRYYSSKVARFLTADPTLASNSLMLPQNWNRYAYVSGDAVNKTDPHGLCSPQDNPPCYDTTVKPRPSPGPDLAYEDYEHWVMTFRRPRWRSERKWENPPAEASRFKRWDRTVEMLEWARDAVAGTFGLSQPSEKCLQDLKTLGITPGDLVRAAGNATFENGVGSTVPIYTVFKPGSEDYNYWLQRPDYTVGTAFLSPSVNAMSVLGGNVIYVRPSAVLADPTGLTNAGRVTHELVHNIGLIDDQIADAFGHARGGSTAWITDMFTQDCFVPPPILLY